MTRILAISGSLRAGSYNTALARAAQRQAADGVEIEVATLHGIPLYDGDVEATQGLPEAVQALRARILASDALLLVTPEYNNGIPGVFKNAIDWLSRSGKEVLAGKPVALIGASPGGFGTVLAQSQWLPVLRLLEARLWTGGRMLVARVQQKVDGSGEITDSETLTQLAGLLREFAASLQR